MQHFSTWFRCIAIDTPGYGRSPKAEDGVTADEIAQAFWDAIDEIAPGEPVILVGCSGGFMYALDMQALHPDRTAAVVLTGAGYMLKTYPSRLEAYEEEGLGFRWRHIALDFAPAFNATPMARYMAKVMLERDSLLDLETIKSQYRAHAMSDPDASEEEASHSPRMSVLNVKAPCLIVTGTEDALHQASFTLNKHIKGSELQVMPGAGHCTMMEQPGIFDGILIDFLEKHSLMKRAEPAR